MFHRNCLLGCISLLGLFLIAGCGPSKIDECRKISDTVNRVATDTEANLKKGEVARLEEAANGLSALQLKDQKLKEFQARFVESYRAKQRILVAKTAQTGNLEAINNANAELTVELGKSQLLEQEFNSYCR